MKHLQPAVYAVTALLLLGLTAWNAQSNMLQYTLSTASIGDLNNQESSDNSQEALRLADDLQKAEPKPPKVVDSETLWLARVIYSETKQPHEQELIAWVVRNRVETNFRGNTTYRETVLDPYQFSAFNPGDRKRDYYSNLEKHSNPPGWQKAIEIAKKVQHKPPTQRPFSISTRHFYSERSMVGHHEPRWANGQRPNLSINQRHNVDERRFRFFNDVS